MNWLSDTWREVTSGGKARTATYNGRRDEPARRASSPAPKRSASTTTSRGSGGGGGGGRVSATRAPVVAPPPRARAQVTVRSEKVAPPPPADRQQWGPRLGANTPQRPTSGYQPRTPQEADERQRQATMDAYVPLSVPGSIAGTRENVPRPQDQEVAVEQREVEAREKATVGGEGWSGKDVIAARGGPRVQHVARELSDEEYLALSPRQRAAVQYNTGLVSAANADRADGTGTQQTQAFLSELDLPTEDLDAFLRLDRAIGDNILRTLEDPTTRAQSAESLRLARGNVAAAPESTRISAARDAAANAADAMQTRLANGWTGLRGGTQRPGMTDSPRDQVLRMAWDFMVDASVDQTPDDIAMGLSQLNANMGTDIAPQELWDFARLQLDAADFGRLRNADVTVPVTDATIVPLSVADIRARYGI